MYVLGVECLRGSDGSVSMPRTMQRKAELPLDRRWHRVERCGVVTMLQVVEKTFSFRVVCAFGVVGVWVFFFKATCRRYC